MKLFFWYAGGLGTLLCMLVILSKFVLLGLGSDINPHLGEIADKLPRTKICLAGMIFFSALMLTSRFI